MLNKELRKISVFEEAAIRIFDVAFSILAIITLLPVMAVVALAIKLTSKGSILYKQKRVGKNGRLFNIYKFRSMFMDAESQNGPMLALFNDPRVTSVGRVLRRTRLDEVPQFFNIIRGDMSLVGPRPERPELIEMDRLLHRVRVSVRPGITGLAQIEGPYRIKPINKLRYDYLYIKNRSFVFNILMILRTVPVIILKEGS
jgi:Sugar transferases involved in lipopolysaccharide synthesis